MKDLYASEEECKALIQSDIRTAEQKKSDEFADKNWANEQGIEPQRKPLTDEQIKVMWRRSRIYGTNEEKALAFASAIEAAHGIKE